VDIRQDIWLTRARHEDLLREAREAQRLRGISRVSFGTRLIAWLYERVAKPELERKGRLQSAAL
jgi:hypothetical protein